MQFTRGDTFYFAGPVTAKVNGVETTDLSNWSAQSQIRTDKGALIDDLVLTWLSQAPIAAISLQGSGSTVDWPLGEARIDIEFTTSDGKIVSTSRQAFQIVLDVTRVGVDAY